MYKCAERQREEGRLPGCWRLTLLPESLGPHSPLSYHHLFFSLSKTPASLSFNTARFTGVLQITGGTREGWGGENNINNIIGHVILCYSISRSPTRAAQYSSQSDEAGRGPHLSYMSLCSLVKMVVRVGFVWRY